MSEWKTVRLRDVCDSVDYGLTASASESTAGPKFLRITDVVNPKFDWSSVPHVAATSAQAEKYKVHHGDIVIARTGATTGHGRWIDNPPDAIFASYLVRLKVSNDINSRFLGYLLKSDQFMGYVRGVLGDKSAQPNASATTLTAARLSVPAKRSEQDAIASVLGALDDKIAVNDRIATTTLALADSIFESVASEVERGADTFASATDVFGGGTPRTSEPSYWDGEIAWTTPTDVTGLRAPYLFRTKRTITDAGLDNCASRLYPASSIFMTSRATIGAFAIPQVPAAVNQGFIVVVPPRPELRWWLFHEMRSKIDEMISLANGSTFLELSRKNFKAIPIRLVDDDTLAHFHARVNPLHERAAKSTAETATLAELQDALLPKLMSGEIRVRDAEKAMEDIAGGGQGWASRG
jgi:type I restriction enzyme, S subunit